MHFAAVTSGNDRENELHIYYRGRKSTILKTYLLSVQILHFKIYYCL